jgi:hypothetical protein
MVSATCRALGCWRLHSKYRGIVWAAPLLQGNNRVKYTGVRTEHVASQGSELLTKQLRSVQHSSSYQMSAKNGSIRSFCMWLSCRA